MTRVPPIAIALIAVMAAATCDKNSPTQPSQGTKTTTTTRPPSLQSITIDGPSSSIPGTHVQYTATGHISDGTTEDLTSLATWRSSDTNVMSISPHGEGTVGQAGEAVLAAEQSGRRASLQVLVLAPGTFKVSGVVSDSDIPVSGATVDLLDGSRAIMSSLTDNDGVYRLYGVSGGVELRVRAPGYADQVKSFSVTSTRTFDFVLPATDRNVAGSYVLQMTAASRCPQNGLPAGLRVRTYDATITQQGIQLSVNLGGASLLFGSFNGVLTGTVAKFQVHGITPFNSFYYYYYQYFDRTFDLVEQLSSTDYFLVTGNATLSLVPSGLSGQLQGFMADVSQPKAGDYVRFKSVCGGQHTFVFTRR